MVKIVRSFRVDDELWKDAKKYAIDHDETMTDLVTRLLKAEMKK